MNQRTYHGWNTFEIVNGYLTVRVAPEIGGRILSLEWRGTELLFTQKQHRGEVLHPENHPDPVSRKKELGFRLWGGDKTWISPQNQWANGIPPLDLDAGIYSFSIESPDRLRMESPLCRETGLKITRILEIRKPGLRLTESIQNFGESPARRGVWNVSQLLRPFLVLFPACPDEVHGYKSEGDSVRLKKEMVQPVKRDGWSRILCDRPVHFKFGTTGRSGHLVAFREGSGRGRGLAHIRRFSLQEDATYAHDASMEVFNSPDYDYLELEVHAPLRELQPGDRSTLIQDWEFLDWDGDLESLLEYTGSR